MSAYYRNVRRVFSASVLAQCVSVFAIPVTSRLYPVEAFERLGVIAALIAILSSVMCSRFNIAIPLARSVREMYSLCAISALVAALFFVAIISIIFFSQMIHGQVFPSVGETDLYLVAFGALGLSIFNVVVACSSYFRDFGVVSVSKFQRAVISAGSQIALGVIGSGAGLIIGYLGLCWAGLLAFSVYAKRHITLICKVPISRLRSVLVSNLSYVKYSVPEILFFNVGTQLPIVLIAVYTENAEAGIFFLALRILGAPMALLGQSIATVYSGHAPGCATVSDLHALTTKTMLNLARWASAPLLVFGLLAPFFAQLIFGEQWEQLGRYIALLSLGSALQLICAPVALCFHILDKLRFAMYLQAFLAVLRLLPVWIALAHDTELFVEIYAVSNLLSYGLMMLCIRSLFSRIH